MSEGAAVEILQEQMKSLLGNGQPGRITRLEDTDADLARSIIDVNISLAKTHGVVRGLVIAAVAVNGIFGFVLTLHMLGIWGK